MQGRKTNSDLTIVNPAHMFHHILSSAFDESNMPFQPVRQSAGQMNLLQSEIDMEQVSQKPLK